MLLKKIQHHFTRLFPNLRKLPYEDRLGQLRLWSLEERRNRTDLIELYQMVKGLSATPWSKFIRRSTETKTLTGEHRWKLVTNSCKSDAPLHFYSQRVINRWNSLSQEDIDAPSINSFKNCIERRRTRQINLLKRRIDVYKSWWLHDHWRNCSSNGLGYIRTGAAGPVNIVCTVDKTYLLSRLQTANIVDCIFYS